MNRLPRNEAVVLIDVGAKYLSQYKIYAALAASDGRKRIAYIPLRPELSDYDCQYNA